MHICVCVCAHTCAGECMVFLTGHILTWQSLFFLLGNAICTVMRRLIWLLMSAIGLQSELWVINQCSYLQLPMRRFETFRQYCYFSKLNFFLLKIRRYLYLLWYHPQVFRATCYFEATLALILLLASVPFYPSLSHRYIIGNPSQLKKV